MSDAPNRPLRVCLDARVSEGVPGGVQQTIIGLADGLSRLGGDEEYVFLTRTGLDAWLRPHVRGNCRIIHALPTPRPVAWKRAVRALLVGPLRSVDQQVVQRVIRMGPPPSDGTIEAALVDVMHFTAQDGFLTQVPSIYVPHDLQHLHYPEFFSVGQRRWRAAVYPALARQARHVVALSHHGKADIVSRLGVLPDNVSVIGWAPVVDTYGAISDGDVARIRAKFGLPPEFALYPAQTWRHKNHLRLLEAIGRLRDCDGLQVPLVFTGQPNEFHPVVERRVRALRLEGQVFSLGFVSPLEMQALYRLARVLVYPSQFEGFGMPVVEGFRAGVPVACSNATSLPEVAGDAAEMFDPSRVDEIAAGVRRLWTDPALRADLVMRGRRRVEGLSWREVARRYRALYRLVVRRELGEEDRALLAEIA